MASETLKSEIERRSGVALWRQIADAIRAGISSGLGDDSGKLPPEMELAKQFGVNRHTVRSAISALVNDGILRAEQGRGTFIIEPNRLTYPISKRTRFSAGMAAQGTTGSTVLVSCDRVAAKHDVAEALGLPLDAPVFSARTVGMGDDIPVSRSTSWYDAARFPDFAKQYQSLGSVTKAFAACGLSDYVRHSTIIEAYHATVDDVRIMRLTPGAIVLVTHAINHDLEGRPIEYSKTRFSADRINLEIDMNEEGQR
ncbi:phosphonate metabolism transcriptional regulator PhnF [Cohaesibacter sp. CAU 1516]|uniref:phosphonate metabolism transcriptional regulator PhnF n=1 Tax=Cohaesibacter sp. CAU 1516 TaxID=2576038 RepID=UPI0010FDA095|nr:phosphonate metabolism transcriptional regulator PhnF [Cohaesibacter sp. CAU 1516]TLP44773.1 phosphonate metabolism transcriptional regulator PhnF [Cohaesibacter sp. CAU 1516]